MRPERTPKTLEDIRDAASFVLSAAEGKTLEDYSENRLLRQAIERSFEIIGEAVGRLARNDPETASRLSEHPRIVAFRNILITATTSWTTSWCGTQYEPSYPSSSPKLRSC